MSNQDITPPQVITCRAVVCWGPDQPLKLEEITVDPPKASEVRVKLLYASVCHSDLLGSRGKPVVFPRILGHEGVGEVESLGSEVTGFKIGDVVVPVYIGECGSCSNCKKDKTNLCLVNPLSLNGLLRDGTSRMSAQGKPLFHFLSCSTWSEYTVIDASYLVRVDSAVEPRHASFLSCGFSTGYGAAWKEAHIEPGSTVAVLGLGAVGLGVIKGSSILGATTIIGVDLNEAKRGKGEAFGMTHFLNPNQSEKSITELIQEMTGGMGVDYCFECTGVTGLVSQAVDSTKPGGGMAVIIGAGDENELHINFMSLIMGRTIKGTIFGGIKPRSDLPVLFDKCERKEIQLDQLASHEISLEELPNVEEILKEADCVKISIKF
ncbi:hypothetical protein MLD38_025145 [Melastoma candidum]|uniref:Uncharacterized protein n=1 Tax=Melastoma candidum TaxID=119954 RepID=A0ACB9P1C7_9MYRT|nr:hypothetical protein MLD38_025145 [Melastoma candidum]